MAKVLIIHHNDADGYMSGAIAYNAMQHFGHEIKSYKYNYGDDYNKFCQPEAKKSECIYILDVCLPDEFMSEHAEKIVWIDHHTSTITHARESDWFDRLKDHSLPSKDPKHEHIESTDRESASDLCWNYFYPGTIMPDGVYLVGRHDVWDHEGNDSEALSVFLKFGMYRRKNISEEDNIYRKLIVLSRNDQEYMKYLSVGRSILMTKRSIDYHDLGFSGYKSCFINKSICIIHANIPGRNSSFFNGAPHFYRDADIVVPYYYEPRTKLWRVSLFKAPWAKENTIKALDVLTELINLETTGVDTTNGGGHLDACGYTTTNIERDFHNLLLPPR